MGRDPTSESSSSDTKASDATGMAKNARLHKFDQHTWSTEMEKKLANRTNMSPLPSSHSRESLALISAPRCGSLTSMSVDTPKESSREAEKVGKECVPGGVASSTDCTDRMASSPCGCSCGSTSGRAGCCSSCSWWWWRTREGGNTVASLRRSIGKLMVKGSSSSSSLSSSSSSSSGGVDVDPESLFSTVHQVTAFLRRVPWPLPRSLPCSLKVRLSGLVDEESNHWR
mmetsp:Transcript_36792/g.105448  ORF Transcript_36792/g.105448 Transcript_36792/m.105448 type:complete len:228 (-) Transcript_36792:1407-2090(-)